MSGGWSCVYGAVAAAALRAKDGALWVRARMTSAGWLCVQGLHRYVAQYAYRRAGCGGRGPVLRT